VVISAEIRWFWRGSPPPGLIAWFHDRDRHGCAAGGGRWRRDAYAAGAQRELGLKQRGTKSGVEVKGFIGTAQRPLDAPPFVGPIELWGKWSSPQLVLQATVMVRKQRWLRMFAAGSGRAVEIALDRHEAPVNGEGMRLPEIGCTVEVTRILAPDDAGWWTLGLEAFGSISGVEDTLRLVSRHVSTRNPPLAGGWITSYPLWLEQFGRAR
jgi:hypothetical protein